MLENFTQNTFEPLVGTRFALAATTEVELELITVTPSDHGFALLFTGPVDLALSQGTHELSHPELGTFPLFLTAVGVDDRSLQYEAVFSRLT